MIVGCYTLDLYCCCAECKTSGIPLCAPGRLGQFTGHTEGQATREARRRGWRVNHKAGLCWAPKHVRRPGDTPC